MTATFLASLPWITLNLAVLAAVWAATAHALLRIADDLRDEHARSSNSNRLRVPDADRGDLFNHGSDQ